jgi:hypothetical protein
MTLQKWLKQKYYNNVRTVLMSIVATSVLVIATVHYEELKASNQSLRIFLKGFLVDWPAGALTLTIAFVTFFGVDVVRDKSERIEEALQNRLNTFREIQREAFELLNWVTKEPDEKRVRTTKFWMTAATPVFGLEADAETVDEWTRLFQNRLAAKADTALLCYQWFDPTGMDKSALAKFAKALSEARGGSRPKWWEACVKAWQEFDRLQRIAGANEMFRVRLINEPNFGIIYAERSSTDSAAIIYLSNSATPKEGAVGFRTKDPNWLELIRRTFKSLLESADLPPEPEDRRLVARDKELYDLFLDQYETCDRNPTNLSLSQHITLDDEIKLPVRVFPSVFPIDYSLDTLHLVKAVDLVIPAIRKHLPHFIGRILGVDVGTGTGAIGIAMAQHTDDLLATDNYDPACKNALFNFRTLAISDRDCHLLKGLKPFRDELEELGQEEQAAQLREENYHRSEKYNDGVEMGRPFIFSRQVINCDLAKEVFRRRDDELIVLAFNYPAYPSPSNVFNCGGKSAGRIIVAKLLADMRPRLRCSDIILLPELHFSEASAVNILDIAHRNGYDCEQVYKHYVDRKQSPQSTIESVTVYALAKTSSDDKKSGELRGFEREGHELLGRIASEARLGVKKATRS